MVPLEFRSRLGKKVSPVAFCFVVVLLGLTFWIFFFKSIPKDHKLEYDNETLDYYIASTVVAEYGFQSMPELKSWYKTFNFFTLQEELDTACGFAKKDGWLSNEMLHQWC